MSSATVHLPASAGTETLRSVVAAMILEYSEVIVEDDNGNWKIVGNYVRSHSREERGRTVR